MKFSSILMEAPGFHEGLILTYILHYTSPHIQSPDHTHSFSRKAIAYNFFLNPQSLKMKYLLSKDLVIYKSLRPYFDLALTILGY